MNINNIIDLLNIFILKLNIKYIIDLFHEAIKNEY